MARSLSPRTVRAGAHSPASRSNGDLASSLLDDGLGAGQSAIAAIDLDAAGNIIVGGSGGASHPNDFALAELGPDGTPQCGRAGPCFVETDFAGGADRLRDVVATPDGLTLAAGVVTGPAGAQLGVARYLPDGTLDSSFSGDGKLIVDTGGASSFAKNAVVAVSADGSILLAGAGPAPDGSGRGDLLLAKLEPTAISIPPSAAATASRPWTSMDATTPRRSRSRPTERSWSGSTPARSGLTTDCNPALARFTAAGELDPGFGSGGVVSPAAGAEVRVLPNGSVFAAGTTRLREHFQTDFALGVYLTQRRAGHDLLR